MEENMKCIYEDIISSCRLSDNIINILKNISGNSVIIGNGGSRVVAVFLAKVLSKKNKIITSVHDSCDLSGIDLDNYKSLIIASYSGSNQGVHHAISFDINKYMMTTRKTPIGDETLLTYQMEKRKSFISLNQTIVPMAIILKYYLGEYFDDVIEDIFKLLDKTLEYNITDVTNIFSDYKTNTSSTFIESTLAESGMSVPIVQSKYDYCHGRSTINKDKHYKSIYLINKKTELDETLLSILKNPCVLSGPFQDEIINDFFLTLQAMYLLKNIAYSLSIDLSKIDYDKEVIKKLYNFKGSM